LVDLDPDFALFSILQLLPNTDLYRQGLEKGLCEPGRWEEFAMNPDRDFRVEHWTEFMTVDDLIFLRREAYRRFYLRPRYVVRSALQTRTWHEFTLKVASLLLLVRGSLWSFRKSLGMAGS
jgi:hypothetical protein